MANEKNVGALPARQKLSLGEVFVKYSCVIIFVLLVIVSAILSPNFLTKQNIFNVLLQQVPYILIAFGSMLTLMTGGIDLSTASIAACGNVLVSIIITKCGGETHTAIVFVAVLAAAAVGCILGLISGLLIGKAKMAAFIVTLAMMSAAEGIAYMMTNGANIPLKANLNKAAAGLIWFASKRDPLGVPIAVYASVVVILVFWYIMKFTPFGRHVLAVGSNEAAVHLAGINVDRIKILVYVISGGMAGLAGAFTAGRTALGTPGVADSDYALTTVAACVIGGVSLAGGKGNVPFTIVGVLIMALISNIMNLVGLANFHQMVVKGAVIILAIFIGSLGEKIKK